MDFSDHSNKSDKILHQIIQKGLLTHTEFTAEKLSNPLYGESVLRSVKLSCSTATHIVHRTIFSRNLTMFSMRILTKSQKLSFGFLFFQHGKPYAKIWFLNWGKATLFALASTAF